jgi:multiple sugar transport system substrate-binding protein
VVVTPNITSSIMTAIKAERPSDYYENTATIEWPLGLDENRFPIVGDVFGAVVFVGTDHVATAQEFLRFLVEESWLAHYLDFVDDRMLPPIAALRDQPFRLDTRDPHKLAAVVQAQSRPLAFDYTNIDQRLGRVYTERVWAKAVHRVATEGVSPEQAVDEAITRIKQLLSE